MQSESKRRCGAVCQTVSHNFPVQPEVNRELENGLYVVAIPELHLRHGFEVTGPQSHLVQVSGKGAPVAPGGPTTTSS